MFFGLTNSPAMFQTMMNDIFQELINKEVVVIYMDDILIPQPPDKRRTPCHHSMGSGHPPQTSALPQGREVHVWTATVEYLGLILSEVA